MAQGGCQVMSLALGVWTPWRSCRPSLCNLLGVLDAGFLCLYVHTVFTLGHNLLLPLQQCMRLSVLSPPRQVCVRARSGLSPGLSDDCMVMSLPMGRDHKL